MCERVCPCGSTSGTCHSHLAAPAAVIAVTTAAAVAAVSSISIVLVVTVAVSAAAIKNTHLNMQAFQ